MVRVDRYGTRVAIEFLATRSATHGHGPPPVTAGCRSIKSPAELALLKLANDITFNVYKAVYLSCGPGDTNQKFSDLVDKAYTRSGVRGEVSCNVGPNSAIPHGTGKPQIIHESEIVMIDDGCTCDGYTSDITRSFVYGKPTDFQRTIFEIVHNAQSAALAAAGPGVPMQIVDSAARQVIVEAGYGPGYDYFTHRVGHGIGLDMHEWPYLVQGNAQKMMTGMVFSDEPGIYLPGKFGIRLEDDMHITDNGAEMFTWQSPKPPLPANLPTRRHQLHQNPSTSNPPGAPFVPRTLRDGWDRKKTTRTSLLCPTLTARTIGHGFSRDKGSPDQRGFSRCGTPDRSNPSALIRTRLT